MKKGKVFLGILTGVAVGALLGVLFAPKKGTKTRKQILKKGEEYADHLLETRNKLVNEGKKYAEGLQEKYDETIKAINDKYESLMHKADTMVSNGKSKIEEVKKEVKA